MLLQKSKYVQEFRKGLHNHSEHNNALRKEGHPLHAEGLMLCGHRQWANVRRPQKTELMVQREFTIETGGMNMGSVWKEVFSRTPGLGVRNPTSQGDILQMCKGFY